MGSVIGAQRRRFWEENGFLVFPGFFDEEELELASAAADRAWEKRSDRVVVDDLVSGRRCHISDLSDEEEQHAFKTNDLYLTEPDVRNVALSERMGLILEDLLDDEPAICNSLHFDKGSQQADHLDTLYMTPGSVLGLTATWVAFEDAGADAGPLRYFPGSNQIPPYRFSTGSMHVVDGEMPRWSDYMAGEVERRGLGEERFLARRGDLFIWHALLLHGGSAIANPDSTRRSMVTHYWTQTDCEVGAQDLRPTPGGWWINRPPLSVPPAAIPAPVEAAGDEEVVDFPASLSTTAHPDAELRERMEALDGAID